MLSDVRRYRSAPPSLARQWLKPDRPATEESVVNTWLLGTRRQMGMVISDKTINNFKELTQDLVKPATDVLRDRASPSFISSTPCDELAALQLDNIFRVSLRGVTLHNDGNISRG